jgi:hypothetical protein
MLMETPQMNMFLVSTVLGLSFKDTQVMLFDKHIDGPFLELIRKAFSPNHEVIRHEHFKGKKVSFRFIFPSVILLWFSGFIFTPYLSFGISCWIDLS